MTWVQEGASGSYNNTQYAFRLDASGVLRCYAGGQDLWTLSLTDLFSNPILPALLGTISLQMGLWQDQKASGTDGGDFTSGAWQTRTLNAAVASSISGAALAANQVTLPVGTYFLLGAAPAYQCESHQLRLQNVTKGTTIANGVDRYNSIVDSSDGLAFCIGVTTLAISSALELQHRCATTKNGNGLGVSTSFGGTEVYANLFALKLVQT